MDETIITQFTMYMFQVKDMSNIDSALSVLWSLLHLQRKAYKSRARQTSPCFFVPPASHRHTHKHTHTANRHRNAMVCVRSADATTAVRPRRCRLRLAQRGESCAQFMEYREMVLKVYNSTIFNSQDQLFADLHRNMTR